MWARRSTGFLLYAALQFVVLTGAAMQVYPSYRFAENFLSELGATQTWYGVPNHTSAGLFAVALATTGIAIVPFAATWRDYAFDRRRARAAGIASQVCGTLAGAAFLGVACTPMNVALDAHNALVVAAFGLLLLFAACATLTWWKNAAPRGVRVASLLYLALLLGYFVLVGWVVHAGVFVHRRPMIVGQKIAVYGSIAYVVFITLTIRRRAKLRG